MKEKLALPLEERIFKYKNPLVTFLCPLCRTERFLSSKHSLSSKNYFQIILLTLTFTLFFYPFMEWRGLFSCFVFTGIIELGVRLYYRKQLLCEYCGFDVIWYKKNIKMANKKVKKFWEIKKKKSVSNP